MSNDDKVTLPRRDALLAMVAGAGLLTAPNILKAATTDENESRDESSIGGLNTDIPFNLPADTILPFGLGLYGKCNGNIDILMSDFTPSLNKYGEYVNSTGNVVADASLAKKSPSKNVLLVARDMPGAKDYGFNPAKKLADGTEYGVDFGGHYHEDMEIIYCTKGIIRVEIRENSGEIVKDFEGDEVLEKAPEASHGKREFQVVIKAGVKTKTYPLTSDIQSFDLEPGGFITIPARAFHSVIMIETGDMLAFLPDGKRWAEQAYSSPGPDSTCSM